MGPLFAAVLIPVTTRRGLVMKKCLISKEMAKNRASAMPMAMILIIVGGIMSSAMMRLASYDSVQVVNIEIEKQLRAAALGGIHYKKTDMFYTSPTQFRNNLNTTENRTIGGVPVEIRVIDNDDGDNNPNVDVDGALVVVARAEMPDSESYFEASVTVRMRTFTEYSVAWRNAVNLGQNFHSTGKMFVGGNITELGLGVRHKDFVITTGTYRSYNGNPANTTWDRDDPTTPSIEPLTQNASILQWPDVNAAQWTHMRNKAISQGNHVPANEFRFNNANVGAELYFDATTGYIWARPRGAADSTWNKTWRPMTDDGIYYFEENVYIRGEYTNRMTIVTAKDAYILNDVIWRNQNTDTLGLMAKNHIILSTWRSSNMNTYVPNDNYRPAAPGSGYAFPYAAGKSWRSLGYFGEGNVTMDLQIAMYAGGRLGVSHIPASASSRRPGTLNMSGSQTSVDATSNAFGNTFETRLYGYNERLQYMPPPDFMAINNVQPVFSLGTWQFDSN